MRMCKDLRNVWNLTKFHTGAAGRGEIIGHLEMTDDALGETQMLDMADECKSIFTHTKMRF